MASSGSVQRADALRGLIIAGGQGKWIGKILRFGHMGEVGIDEMAEAIEIMGEPSRPRPPGRCVRGRPGDARGVRGRNRAR